MKAKRDRRFENCEMERREISIDARNERAKRIRRQLDIAHGFWLEGLTVTLMAQRLGVTKHRVYFLLRVLELRPVGRLEYLQTGESRRKRAHIYGAAVPPIGEWNGHAA